MTMATRTPPAIALFPPELTRSLVDRLAKIPTRFLFFRLGEACDGIGGSSNSSRARDGRDNAFATRYESSGGGGGADASALSTQVACAVEGIRLMFPHCLQSPRLPAS